jgi:hypothetical protein
LLAWHGKHSLIDDIHRYLPEMPEYGIAITIPECVKDFETTRCQQKGSKSPAAVATAPL